MRKPTAKWRRRNMVAWRKHEKSKRRLQQAARDVERHQTCLFVALKHQEKVVAEYNVTAKALIKFGN